MTTRPTESLSTDSTKKSECKHSQHSGSAGWGSCRTHAVLLASSSDSHLFQIWILAVAILVMITLHRMWLNAMEKRILWICIMSTRLAVACIEQAIGEAVHQSKV